MAIDWRLLPDAIAHKWQADCDTACTEEGCEVTWRDTRFPEPTVAELEAALREYLDSSSADSKPKWDQFQAQMLMSGAYLRIAGTNPTTQTLNAALIWMLGEVGAHPEQLSNVINTWNAIAYIAQVTPEETDYLRQVCVACNMPFNLVDGGFMVAA